MATTTPSPPPTSPHDQVEDDHQPPVLSSSPPRGSVPSQSLPIEESDHHQFANSNSPYSPPQTSVAPPENTVEHQQPPSEGDVDEQELPVPPSPPVEENILDRQQPLVSPSPSSHLPPPPPPPPPIGVEYPPESTGPDHDSPCLKQSPHIGHEDPVKTPNRNPNSDHESLSPSSPTTLEGNPSPKSHQSPQNPSPSPPPTTESPSSPIAPPLGVPLLLQPVVAYSPSKPQPSPWTHQETANLIQAYQEKWYSLKKGPLKAGQWEEVAITVAARCGYDEPTKTAKQCRHKIEKLRKRYRAERGKPRSKATVWNFFKLMDNLEKGPLPISSSQPVALFQYQKPSSSNGRKRSSDESDDEFLVNKRTTRSTSSEHHIINGVSTRNLRLSDGGSETIVRRLRTPLIHRNKGFYQEEEEEEEEEEGGNGNGDDEDEEDDVATQLAAEIKGFAEKFVKMENKKIEMIKDVERYRLEMENKRMELILESQQILVETVNRAFRSSLKS